MTSFFDRFTKKSPTDPSVAKAKVADVKVEEKKTTSVASAPAAPAIVNTNISERNSRVLIQNLTTEKITNLAVANQVAFKVADFANKIDVIKAVTAIYGVKPEKVRMINNKGKKVRFGRSLGQRRDWKKAIVTLPAGTSLEVFHGVK